MDIALKDIAKKYNREYIFKGLNYEFKAGNSYAITGSNGSGKSTLVQLLSGYLRPSSGELLYNQGALEIEEVFHDISIATPYMELIEEFTLTELVDFHFKFKTLTLPKNEIIERAYLQHAKNKPVKNFSSGMKQRLKLALALFSDTSVLLLDEPTSNLDKQGVDWYKQQLLTIHESENRLIIVASNQPHEYDFCGNRLNIEDFK